MAQTYVALPLYPDAYYTYSIALEGNSYVFEFVYNERMQLYTFSLLDAENTPIIQGEALVPYYPMLIDYALPDLTGFMWMELKSQMNPESYKMYPDKIDQYYNMWYCIPDEG